MDALYGATPDDHDIPYYSSAGTTLPHTHDKKSAKHKKLRISQLWDDTLDLYTLYQATHIDLIWQELILKLMQLHQIDPKQRVDYFNDKRQTKA